MSAQSVGSSGNDWSFHPKPQSRPQSIMDAIKGADTSGTPPFNDSYAKLYNQVPRGRSAAYVIGKGFNNCVKPHPSKPSPTLPKTQTGRGFATVTHPFEPRGLSIGEAKRIGSFPDDFILTGTYIKQFMCIGNSVPPNLMHAIAENIRKAPFMLNVHTPTVISTFAGCGGSSLGYKLAGFRELLAVEWDDNAVETFTLNFPEVPVYHGDIAKLTCEECMALAGGLKPGELDVFDGSPPCQGFSTAGRRRYDDPRNSLFKEYVRLLDGLQPKVFVMENVTGMVKGYMKQAYLTIVRSLRECGYQVKGEILNAKYYNVPQSRQRVIVIGVRNDLGLDPSHPKPQTKAMTIQEALDGCNDHDGLTLSGEARALWNNTLPGNTFDAAYRAKEHRRGYYTHVRPALHQPHPVILCGTTVYHPSEPRRMSGGELKRIASFPDTFELPQIASVILKLIGNCVPPNLMCAIAKHVRAEILDKCNA